MTTRPRTPGFATGLAVVIPITLSTMAIILLAPIVPQLMSEFGNYPNSDIFVPMVLTVPGLCIAILSTFAGALGDYFGRRRLLIASLAIYGFVGVAPYFLTGLGAIILSRVLVGIVETMIMVTSTTLIGDFFVGKERDKWLAAQTAVASLSAVAFFNLGGLLGQTGWRTPFWMYLSALPMLALVLRFTWEPSGDRGEPQTGEDHLHNKSWVGFPWKRMIGIIGVTVFGSILFYTVQIQASSGLAAHGVTSSARIGLLTSMVSIGVPLGTYIYNKVGHANVVRLLFAEFMILGGGFLIMGFGLNVTQFLAGCAISQIGAGLLTPTLLVWAMSQLRFEFRSRGTGMWQSAFALGQFLSPLVIAYVSRIEGGLLPSFRWLGYAGLLAAAIAFVSLNFGNMAGTRREGKAPGV